MPLGQALGHVGRGWILQMLATAYRRKESVRTTVQPACVRACVRACVCVCVWGTGQAASGEWEALWGLPLTHQTAVTIK